LHSKNIYADCADPKCRQLELCKARNLLLWSRSSFLPHFPLCCTL